MATLSTLELMLVEIQKQENLETWGDLEQPPRLPPRPVSKARTPPRRATRAISSFQIQEFVDSKDFELVAKSKRTKRDALIAYVEEDNGEIKIKNGREEKALKGLIGIQKCFRGYQARARYHELKEGIITLQSFIRGENARIKFQKTERKTLGDPEVAIVYLQSVIRGWLSRRHLNNRVETKNTVIRNTKYENHLNENFNTEDRVMVSYSYILDLKQQLLKTEDALRKKKEENSTLLLQIQHINQKWHLHEAKMDAMEKSWQDEFASIQMSLASAQDNLTNEITHLPQNHQSLEENGEVNLTIKEILELQEIDMHDIDSRYHVGDLLDNVLYSRRCQKEELRNLKGQFKVWKKDFKARLREIKGTLDKLDHSKVKKIHRRWCVT